MTKELKTGELVLCKVGSFPPWPAVVVPQRLLRKDVYRKRRPNCAAVCFFNDPTYYWEQPQRLNKLEPTAIEEFLTGNSKAKNQQELLEAYRQARDFTNLHDFLVNRAKEESRFEELKREIGDEEIMAGEDPFLSKTDSKKRKQSSPPASDKRKRTRDDGNNRDGTIHDSSDDSNGRLREQKPNSKRSHTEDEKKNKLDLDRRIEICMLFRRRLQKNLVQRDSSPTDDEIAESHKMLHKIHANVDNKPPFFDLDALRQSKLHKLLKVIVNDSDLEEFHPICKSILMKWAHYISELKAEKAKTEQRSTSSPASGI
ncbi:hypothetical protein HG536_0F00470 [Torulaspora globosa]|uniref:PWWP domain-containing protein n=1 Tax=Torulaspora globosa TaxID=48254 RepID=A0A7G3ZJN7_9SACH|nr:uncharacterized protein HG536_0F00470 [Torulaspora globosa]QLL33723.1 hypothetical protein HG536_0F00470 [Torulaspora globosa]